MSEWKIRKKEKTILNKKFENRLPFFIFASYI